MAKRRQNGGGDNKVIVWIVAIFLGLYLLNSAGMFDNLNLESGSTSTTTTLQGQSTSTTLVQPQEVGRADLQALMIPYIASSNAITDCTVGGGEWMSSVNKVGCEGFTGSPINCGGAIAQSARIQCEATGATWVCNDNNIYCYYP